MHTLKSKKAIIGVISDTHGPVDDNALAVLEGVDSILHAGDIVSQDVIPALSRIAPVTAVTGNMDEGGIIKGLKKTAVSELSNVLFYMLHDLSRLDLDPKEAGIGVVVHGHTHRAEIQWINGVLFLNPGSAGQSRYGRPTSVALVEINNGEISPRIVDLTK